MWVFITILVSYLFYYSWYKLRYFSSKGVKALRPLPFLGNLAAVTFRRENLENTIDTGYDTFKKERYFGLYQYLVPTLVPKDPELIRQIMVRDFNSFAERGVHIGADCDPLFGKNLIMLTGSKWRSMRAALSPSFSSARCRSMTGLMAVSAKSVEEYLHEATLHGPTLTNINEITMSYVNDVIASCAFGITVDSLKDRDNVIFKLGKKAVIQDTAQAIKFFAYENMKSILKLFKVKIISSEDANQLSQFFKAVFKARRENLAPPRPDFIQVLIDAAQGLDNDELVAQAILFYVAGYGTTANLINYFLYEMAANPHVQKKLQEELDLIVQEGKDIYEQIHDLQYLEMCVSEVLRLWPLVGTATRRTVTTYDFGPTYPGSKDRFIAPSGVHVWVPLYSLHRDEKYWPNPNVCDPERFTPENKAKIVPYTYMPFGAGPKQCIGSRFGLLAAKVFIIKFFKKYQTIKPPNSDHTKLSPRAFILRPADGYNVIIEPRILN